MMAMPRAAGHHRPRGRSGAWLAWLIGGALVAVLLVLLARSIPAAPRPSLGPPSTPVATQTPPTTPPPSSRN